MTDAQLQDFGSCPNPLPVSFSSHQLMRSIHYAVAQSGHNRTVALCGRSVSSEWVYGLALDVVVRFGNGRAVPVCLMCKKNRSRLLLKNRSFRDVHTYV